MADPRTDLTAAIAEHVGAPPLSSDEIEAILSLAAVAAHRTGDRTSAPLTSYLAGIAAASASDRTASLDDLRRIAADVPLETELT